MATLNIDDELYQEYEVAAKDAGRSTDEFIALALQDWLVELQDDIQAANEGVAEYDRRGGVPHEQIGRELATRRKRSA